MEKDLLQLVFRLSYFIDLTGIRFVTVKKKYYEPIFLVT